MRRSPAFFTMIGTGTFSITVWRKFLVFSSSFRRDDAR